MRNGPEVDAAIARAVRRALMEHKAHGHCIAVWREGKAVMVLPEEIVIVEEE